MRIATGLRKQRGSESEISPLLALNAMLRDGRAWPFRAPEAGEDGSCYFVRFISTFPPRFIENKGRRWELGDGRTTIAWREPSSVHKSKEALFDVALPSWMSSTSAVMGPLVV